MSILLFYTLVAISGCWCHGQSTWNGNRARARGTSLAKAIDIAELFQQHRPTDGAEFADLPAHELADSDRYERVEKRIKRGRTKLKPV